MSIFHQDLHILHTFNQTSSPPSPSPSLLPPTVRTHGDSAALFGLIPPRDPDRAFSSSRLIHHNFFLLSFRRIGTHLFFDLETGIHTATAETTRCSHATSPHVHDDVDFDWAPNVCVSGASSCESTGVTVSETSFHAAHADVGRVERDVCPSWLWVCAGYWMRHGRMGVWIREGAPRAEPPGP